MGPNSLTPKFNQPKSKDILSRKLTFRIKFYLFAHVQARQFFLQSPDFPGGNEFESEKFMFGNASFRDTITIYVCLF